MTPPVVAFCSPIYRHGTHEYWQSRNRLWTPARVRPDGIKLPGATHMIDLRDKPVREAREQLTRQALDAEPRVTHILWVDDDMQFAPDALMRLLAHRRDIVGGLCFNRRQPYQPTLLRRHPPELARDTNQLGFVYDYTPGLNKVDATGTGFLLVARQVFETLRGTMDHDGWFDPYGDELSEDIAFCLRAGDAGFDVWVDADTKIGHVAEVVIDESFARRNRRFEWESWQESATARAGDAKASIVIPTYDQDPAHLAAAVSSAMYQTVPVQVIVVDDGSTPAVDASTLPDGVELVRHAENQGIAAALNTGITAMRTDWFCWLSSDDLLDPRKVQNQLVAAHDTGGLALFHRYQSIVPDEAYARIAHCPSWIDRADQRAKLRQGCCINGSTVMLHRSVIDDVGGFDTSYAYSQDWEMWLRVGERYDWIGVGNILGTRRESGHNLTAVIRADEALAARHVAEDRRILEVYGSPEAPAAGNDWFRLPQ